MDVKGKGIMTLLEKYELRKMPKHEENLQWCFKTLEYIFRSFYYLCYVYKKYNTFLMHSF
jgi:hypothetical protein